MSSRDRDTVDYPILTGVLHAVADWVNRHRASAGRNDDLGSCDATEVRRMAGDLNLSEAELRAMAGKGRDAAKQLTQLLVALKVDPAALANAEPAVMHDLQRVCSGCSSKKRCAHDLEDGTMVEHFPEFCPNAYTLTMILEEKGRAPAA